MLLQEIICAEENVTEICNISCWIGYAEEDASSRDENLLLAFALVAAAGLSTTFGSAMVLCKIVQVENKGLLGSALGFSGGVMIYVSFVEIFQKSIEDFAACGCLWKTVEMDGEEETENAAAVMATICFFGGVALTYALDLVVHHMFDGDEIGVKNIQLDRANSDHVGKDDVHAEDSKSVKEQKEDLLALGSKLRRMGIKTALAIGLHNFPEGLATFVATLADPTVGGALAVAIAIHNIPEGLCVAIPVYYATGSRFKGFLLSFFSGFTELLGAVMGYLFLRTVLGSAAYGTLFGIVAGMMVTIVLKELIPTAHRYDPEDKYVSKSIFVGAFVMALSLILFIL
eukprot:snap_masked-scaffold_40-processed-gene-0.31-mRNA-1 protein AED:0.01 eAED:0.01 QI:306/1/1/1/0.5/0.33/3/150/342